MGVRSLLVHVVPGIELRASGLTAGVFTFCIVLLARRFLFIWTFGVPKDILISESIEAEKVIAPKDFVFTS